MEKGFRYHSKLRSVDRHKIQIINSKLIIFYLSLRFERFRLASLNHLFKGNQITAIIRKINPKIKASIPAATPRPAPGPMYAAAGLEDKIRKPKSKYSLI